MNNLHQYIQPQLESIVDELIFKGLTLSELLEPLNYTHYWHKEMPYRDINIRFGKGEHTISEWITLHGLIQGDYRPFNTLLLLQFSTTIEARWEIKQRHEQEDLTAKFQQYLEVAV